MQPFAEPVGFRTADFRSTVVNLVDREVQFERMREFASAELGSIVGEQVLDGDIVFVIERQHALMQPGQAAVTDLKAHTSNYSLAVSGGSANAAGTCVASASYTVSGYYQTSSGVSATVTTTGSANQTNTLSPASVWTHFSFTFSGPASCSPGVSIGLGGGLAAQPVYFDDIALTSPSVSGGANELSGPGFEALSAAWPSGSLARLTQATFHSGTTSMLTPPSGWFSQTVTGLAPSTAYAVSAYISGGPATLYVGSGSTTATGSGWGVITATGTSSATGTLLVKASNGE